MSHRQKGTSMRTHFLVLAYERPKGLASLLASIRAQQGFSGSVEITVLDNASRPHLSTLMEAACLTYAARYVRHTENAYMRGKRLLEDHVLNEGPSPDVVVHLDDDVVLEPGWLTSTTAVLKEGRHAACGSVEHWQGELVYSGQTELRFTELPRATGGPLRCWEWEWQGVGSTTGTVPVAFAGHRALAVLGEAASAVRHDEAYRIGGEDLDYSLELRRDLGDDALAIATSALIQHRAHGEEDAPGFRTPDNVISSWRHFYAKWGFLRTNACTEAGMTLDQFITAVTGAGTGA